MTDATLERVHKLTMEGSWNLHTLADLPQVLHILIKGMECLSNRLHVLPEGANVILDSSQL